MLVKMMIEKLKSDFPSVAFLVNKENGVISIPAKHEEVGGIDIQDDGDELIVVVGNFTHWHAACYERRLEQRRKSQINSGFYCCMAH